MMWAFAWMGMIVFFFSSRRRHTRSKRDWSSDVCSSDLPRPRGRRGRDEHRAGGHHRGAHGDEGARGIDHHRPVSPGRARADVGRADHRRGAGRRARAHRLGGRRARAPQLMTYPLFDPKLSADALEKQLLAAWKHERLFQYKADWETLSERIACWLDYEHPYITYSNDYIETVWWLLKRLYDKALLYRGHKVLPYCPRCGTALSSHELALGYDEVQTNSVFVTFALASDPKRQLVIWTTTPWTLLANVAVAVHPDLEYGEYDVNGVRYIVAVERATHVHVGGKPLAAAPRIAGYPGRDLVGQKYVRPLELVPLPPEGQRAVVVAGGFVSAEEGTGLVHMAPAFGADDYAAAQQYGLAMVNPVAPDGTFQGTGWDEINGRLVTDKETNRLIIERLKREGRWLETLPYTHTYPFCWRCDSALIYYARSSWFVRTTAVRSRMLEVNAQVAWHPPEVGSGRFGAWLENNVDWALSRDRYWGTPLNVWQCDAEAEHREVIGSFAELAERWGKRLPAAFDPHKPTIDQYSWRCRSCGGTMRRVPEVIDAWFDSGAMPYAQWHHPFEHQADFKAHFPADFICEGVDQTRGWFYSLLAIGVTAFDSLVYKNVIVNELVLDAQGQKMSKSRGNVVNPWEVIEEYGADAVRLYLLGQSQVWLPKRFDRRQVPDVAGGFLNTVRHTYNFFAQYAGDWKPSDGGAPVAGRALTDRWVLARLDEVVAAARAAWNDYDVTTGVRAILGFVVDDLSNWYVRTNRPRFWAPDRAADPADLLDILAAEVNAKAVDVAGSDHELVRLKGKAEFRSLGKRYGKDTPRAAALVSQLTAEQLGALEHGDPVRAGEFELQPADVVVTREVVSDWAVQADGPYVVAVDPRLSEDLIQEGLARELVHRVQRLRKEAGYEYTTRIELSVSGAADIVAAVSAFQSFVEGETLARKVVLGAVLDEADVTRELDIEARRVTIALRRHDGRKGGSR